MSDNFITKTEDNKNYFYGWKQNDEYGYSGLFWESKNTGNGPEISPIREDEKYTRFLKSTTQEDSSKVTEITEVINKEYIKQTIEGDMGFVNKDGSWNVRVNEDKDFFVYNNLIVSNDIKAKTISGNGQNLFNLDASKLNGVINTVNIPKNINAENLGNSFTSTSLKDSFKIILSGEVQGEISLNGSNDVTLMTKIVSGNHYTKMDTNKTFLFKDETAENSLKLNGFKEEFFAKQSDLDNQKKLLEDMLSLSSKDKDSFKEIVDFINSIDLENDKSLAKANTELRKKIEIEKDRASLQEKYLEDNITSLAKKEVLDIKKLNNDFSNKINILKEDDIKLIEHIDNSIINVNDSIKLTNYELNKETERSITNETLLQTHINETLEELENSKRILNGKIATETLRANTAEADLNTKLFQEATRAKETEINTNIKLDKEIERSTKEENDLKIKLNEERARAVNEENKINKELNDRINEQHERINDILRLSTEDKDSFAEIVDLINKVDTENDDTFGAFVLETTSKIKDIDLIIDNNIKKFDTVINNINNNLYSEIARAKLKETELQKLVTTETKRSTENDLILTDNIKEETKRAVQYENDLDLKINNEIIRSTDEDKALLKLNNDNYSKILKAASALEANLLLKINNENSFGIKQDELLNTNLSNLIQEEEKRAINNENDLDLKINNNYLKVSDELNNEIALRKSEDIELNTKLETEIKNESDRAEDVEKDLQDQITENKDKIDKCCKIINDDILNIETELEFTNNNINSETKRAIKREDELEDKINNNLNNFNSVFGSLKDSDLDLTELSKLLSSLENLDIDKINSIEQDIKNIQIDYIDQKTFDNLLKTIKKSNNDFTKRINEVKKDLLQEILLVNNKLKNYNTKSESNDLFLLKEETSKNSLALDNENMDDFKDAYLKAVGSELVFPGTVSIQATITKDILKSYFDEINNINYTLLSKIPVGDIISINVELANGEHISLDGKFNQSGKRIEFLKDENIKNSSVFVTYLASI